MKNARRISSWAAGILLALVAVLPVEAAAGRDLNVLLITLDTTRADHVGAYGVRARLTPNIDRMAGRGALFTRAFSHNPMTLPAHANILTGQTPLFHGVSDNNGFRLDGRFLTLPELLKDLNYETAAFVSSFVLDRAGGLDQGFDLYREPQGQDTLVAAEVVPLAREWIASRRGKWFCWLHLWDPHSPYAPPAPFDKRFAADPYAGEVAYMDHELGKLFSFLEKSGCLDSTLLVITGDHGEALGDHGEFEHGYFAYNSTIHVPLIICRPGARRRTVADPVCHADILPTVSDVLGRKPPEDLAGRTLLPLLEGGQREERPIYFESKGPHLTRGWAPLEGFIDGNLKYIDLPVKELYDLQRDFAESKNIISTRRVSDLKRRLEEVKGGVSGSDAASARVAMSAEMTRKLRAFGYLSGIRVEKKAAYTREDDLKILLPIQNKLRLANQLFNDRKYPEAKELYEDVIASRPGDIGSYLHLADTLHFMRRFRAAVDVLRGGLERNPDSLELKAKLGVFLSDIQRHDEAVALLQEVLAADPGSSENWNCLGAVHFRRKDFAAAEEAYAKALALDPANAMAHANLGALFLARYVATRDEAQRQKALAAFNEAIALDERLAAAYNGRGAAYRFAGQVEPALADWRQAVDLRPELTDAHFNIAVTLLAVGRKAEARECLERLRSQHGDLLSASDRQRLQRLLVATGD
ncbi:MAG: sulfatase-like hydrolase/transferase [Candidatus Aminicenantes bacterium]|nr:sulfatase-like hydrolase/transferase [Candidatus Aminicenantes bacterium]